MRRGEAAAGGSLRKAQLHAELKAARKSRVGKAGRSMGKEEEEEDEDDVDEDVCSCAVFYATYSFYRKKN